MPALGEERTSFWKTGMFSGTSEHWGRDLALDFFFWDVARDLPTGVLPLGTNKWFPTVGGWASKISNYWTTGGGSNYASKALGGANPVTWAAERASRAQTAGRFMSYERARGLGRFSGFVESKSSFLGVPYGERTIAAGYGEARLAEKMGWSFLNKEFWAKTTGWGVRAAVGATALSNVVSGVFALSFSAPAIGFSVGRIAQEAFVSSMMERGARDVGRLARADMVPAFYDSREAATMRQAAMQEIQNTQLNLRSAFGREASAIHR